MKKLKVNFRTTDGVDKVGTVVDKVLVAVVGGQASYNNYVIVDRDDIVHIVGLFNIKSLHKPLLANELSSEFKQWADSYFNKAKIYCIRRENLQIEFAKVQNVSPNRFKKLLIAYCDFKGFAFNALNKKVADNRMLEHFEIDTTNTNSRNIPVTDADTVTPLCIDCCREPAGSAGDTCNTCFDKFLNENQP